MTVTTDQLQQFVLALAVLVFVGTICGVLVADSFEALFHQVLEMLFRRAKPPSPESMRNAARILRMRATRLEIEAEKVLALQQRDQAKT